MPNPRFKLWLLLYLEAGISYPSDYCEGRLDALLGSNRYNPAPLVAGLEEAIARAQKMDNAPTERVLPLPGRQLYGLMFAIITA